MGRLKIFVLFLAAWLLVSGILALLSADFGAGFRDGFFDEMNKDFNQIRNVFRSPLLKWLIVVASIYLLAFVPLMWLNARGILGTKVFVRLYLPIWLTIGFVALSLDWLRGKDQIEE